MRRRARGMTMIELMMALAAVTVGLLGALVMTGTLMKGATFSRTATEAMVLVQAKLEAEVSRTAVTLASPANGTTIETGLDNLGQTTGSGPFPYTRSTLWALTTDGLRRRITVTVTWTDANGNAHSMTAEQDRNP